MMDLTALFELLDKHSIDYEKDAKTAALVSFKIGGIANLIVYPENIEELCFIINHLTNKNIKYFVLSLGTNTYFTDSKYEGVVISTIRINKIFIQDNYLIGECGASLFKLCEIAKENSLSGLEFAYGIPGGVGGSVYMNASAYEKSISEIVFASEVYDVIANKIFSIDNRQHFFGDKKSIFSERKIIVLKTKFKLVKSNKEIVSELMSQILNSRLEKQPYQKPSAGSAFKRPKNGYASKLIDQAGMKGMTVGGASISTTHAGFIINNGNATASDVNKLCKTIQKNIKENYNVELEKEIIFVE